MTSTAGPVSAERLETLLLARLSTSGKKPPTAGELAKNLRRYAPATVGEPAWRELVSECLQRLQDRQLVTAERWLSDDGELARRLGHTTAKKWDHWANRVLPGLALGLRADDTRALACLSRSGGLPAAIAGRVLALWVDGPPPSSIALCDALTWRELGLSGAPKACPAAIRAHFVRKHIAADPGPPDQLVRLLAAQAVAAPRPELEAIRAGLVRMWLTGRELKPVEPAPRERSLVEDVRGVVHQARDGVFGDRKVFISSAWHALRATPAWSALELDDFKARLVTAHRNQELVLARADLVAAMDPTLVAASETRTDGATFHFIVREPPR